MDISRAVSKDSTKLITNIDPNFFKTNVAFTARDHIKPLLSPLHEKDISYLTYECYYHDGRHYRLTTHPDWIEYYYKNLLYDCAVFEHQDLFINKGVSFWSDLKREPIYDKASEFDIDHGFTYFFEQDAAKHFFHFGRAKRSKLNPKEDKSILDVYESFSLDFLEKTKSLRKEGERQSIILKPQALSLCPVDILGLLSESLIEEMVIVGNELIPLSHREAKVAKYLYQGGCIKRISDEMGVSERMIKYHVSALKEKMRCKNLVQLGVKLANLKIGNELFMRGMNGS